jgi:hypothetical protein
MRCDARAMTRDGVMIVRADAWTRGLAIRAMRCGGCVVCYIAHRFATGVDARGRRAARGAGMMGVGMMGLVTLKPSAVD